MMKDVLPFVTFVSAFWIICSVMVSTDDVASSSISTLGSPIIALAKDILDAFRVKNILMAVATASSEDTILPLLSRSGIREYFSHVMSCREIGLPKTDPQFFIKCAEIFGERPEDIAMTEDMPHAALNAKKASLAVIGVYDEPSKEREAAIRASSDIFLKTDEEHRRFIGSI